MAKKKEQPPQDINKPKLEGIVTITGCNRNELHILKAAFASIGPKVIGKKIMGVVAINQNAKIDIVWVEDE